MKLLLTLLPALLTQTTGRRNQRIVIGFLLFTTVLVALFSIVFHQIMAYEGRDYSYITGVYWTLTVMSTLGFGDITFTSEFCLYLHENRADVLRHQFFRQPIGTTHTPSGRR